VYAVSANHVIWGCRLQIFSVEGSTAIEDALMAVSALASRK
jgi:hypothetical protein